MERFWTTNEETFIRDRAGVLPVADIAQTLGRTERPVIAHAHDMRVAGRLDKMLRKSLDSPAFKPQLVECAEYHEMRSTCNKDGICRICQLQEAHDRHFELMMRDWRNLPQELREATKDTFDVERAPKLAKNRLSLPTKPLPQREGDFWKKAAAEDYAIALEQYEIRRLNLDIDALKQRRSKWKRKAAALANKKEASIRRPQ